MNGGNDMMKAIRGFTLIELMIVIAIIGIMSTLAVPSYQDRVIRAQVSEGINLSQFAKDSVQAYFARNRQMPKDNVAAGLPPQDKIIGSYVTGISVSEGAISIVFGNRSNRNLSGQKLTLRPAIVDGVPVVPISWVCGNAGVPQKMKVLGKNATTLPGPHLPIDCR
jgi:type IV pilus assembly protein PilA